MFSFSTQGQRAWKELSEAGYWQDRRLTFRGSSLPFCPRAFWLDRFFKPTTWISYESTVRLVRGQAIHEAVQRWLGKAGKLYGDWECPVCAVTLGTTYTVHNFRGLPYNCPRHNVELKYKEYQLELEGFTGHPDGLIPLADTSEFGLLEVKTMQHLSTGNYPCWSNLQKPLEKHADQANAYACVVRKTMKLNVTRVIMWYVSADKPNWQPKIWEFKPNESRFHKHLETIRKIKEQSLEDNPPPKCSARDCDPFCHFTDMCKLPNFNEFIEEKRSEKSTRL